MPFDAATIDFISVPFAKAMAVEDGGARLLFIEASNEARDYQGEVVLARALADSANYYRQFGNIDLDHITQLGPKVGIANYPLFEIGRPVEVAVRDGRTFVKGQLYQGDGQTAEKANMVWDSLTRQTPPARWYPSVGGQVLEKGTVQDPKTGAQHTVIRSVRWTNLALSKTPVNLTVPTVSTVPLDVFAKCWSPAGLDLTKALEAGAGTDVARLEGGAALRKQSLDRHVHSYFEFRDRLAGAIRKKRVRSNADAMVQHAHDEMGMSKAQAAEWTERFLADLRAGLQQRSH